MRWQPRANSTILAAKTSSDTGCCGNKMRGAIRSQAPSLERGRGRRCPARVPDADDTPGAILALKNLAGMEESEALAIDRGLHWLARLQNGDGGMPTFCKGWTKLPFDRSGTDLTAHSIRACHAAQPLDKSRPSSRLVKRALLIWRNSSALMAVGCRSGLAINTHPRTRIRPMAPRGFWPLTATSIE